MRHRKVNGNWQPTLIRNWSHQTVGSPSWSKKKRLHAWELFYRNYCFFYTSYSSVSLLIKNYLFSISYCIISFYMIPFSCFIILYGTLISGNDVISYFTYFDVNTWVKYFLTLKNSINSHNFIDKIDYLLAKNIERNQYIYVLKE